MTEHVLTLDLGSSGIRAVVVSSDWLVVSQAAVPYPNASIYEPAALRQRMFVCLASAITKARVSKTTVNRIAVTAQRGGIAFADADGKTWAMSPNTDTRAVFEGAAIDGEFSADVYSTTGHLPSMFLAPAKLRWYREHHARFSQRFATIATLGSWAAHELTGVFAETSSSLVEVGLGNVATGQPAGALLHQLGIAQDLLPSLVSEGGVVGELTQGPADAIGVTAGTPVALAGPDTQVAVLGAGAVEPGDTVVVAGWSAPVQRVTSSPRFDAARRTWVGRHASGGLWITEANPGDTGKTLETVRNMQDPKMTLAQFDKNAMKARRHVQQRLPIIAAWGPRALDMSNLGMSLGGLIAPSPVTYEGISRDEVAFATIENIAFAIRECMALVDELAGGDGKPLALVGGMASSRFFAQMLTDAVGVPVRHGSPRATAIGAALVSTLAGDKLRKAAQQVGSQAKVLVPDDDFSDGATERYERWLHVHRTLDQLAEEL